MKLRAAIQMDPIETINIAGDSTFALMLEGQRRGHELFYYQTKKLAFREGALYATGHKVRVKDEKGNHFALEPEETEAGYVLACQSHPATTKVELDFDR